MNDEPLNQLFQAGRAAKPDTSPTEFGFEARLMGRIRATRSTWSAPRYQGSASRGRPTNEDGTPAGSRRR